jgi:hypothetical protein
VSRDSLQVVVSLRQLEERRRRTELAECLARAERAKVLLGAQPAPDAPAVGLTSEMFLAERARLHMEWAVYGTRLERCERTASAETAARAAWVVSAADLRSAERLFARRVQRTRREAARRAQRDLDEVAVVRWGRGRP